MSRWIDKRAGFVKKDAMRADKVVAHFNEDGVYKVSQDATTEQTIPLEDVVVLTGATRTILPSENGKTFVCNRAGGVTITLPDAGKGKLTFHFVNPIAADTAHVLTPDATDLIKGFRLSKTAGQTVTWGRGDAEVAADFITLTSDGSINWWLKHVAVTGAPATALPSAQILVGNAGGAAAAVAMTGDVTISNAGVTAIGAKKVLNTMIALADGKILVGDGDGDGNPVTPSGDVTISNAGVTAIGNDKVLSAMLSEKLLKYAEVAISSADIVATDALKLGHAEGYPLVATPCADKAIEFVSAVIINDYDTAAYTDGSNLTVNYEGGGAVLSGAVSAANSLGAAADKAALVLPVVPTNNQLVANKGLNLVIAGAAFTQPGTAAGVARVKVAYRVHTLGLA